MELNRWGVRMVFVARAYRVDDRARRWGVPVLPTITSGNPWDNLRAALIYDHWYYMKYVRLG
jgi:hypothetical protein